MTNSEDDFLPAPLNRPEEGLPRGERLFELFQEAGNLPAEQRRAFLARVCGADVGLMEEVAGLLRQSELAEEEGFLGEALSGAIYRAPVAGSLVGRRVGPYEVQERVGSGGMGSVWRAARVDDYSQEVALKLARAAIESQELERRLQSERQILARLNHPNIARLLDGGTVDGLPYFVMEFIDGQPIDRHCKAHDLALRARVELLVKVCEAVAYAHSQGVVHRDIKPANVLVNAQGEPKLTDFGLAKCWQADEHQTQTGQILGTPAYMAPEQACGQPDAVGPAADVYALGGILYQLMTGRPPFQGQSAQQTIGKLMTVEPTPPRRLALDAPPDLEAVCLKCLEKEPHRRYGSARELAEDLGRFLEGRPVRARPVGRVARAGRWCRRNPGIASLVALVLFSVLAGTMATAAVALWATEHRRDLARTRMQVEQDQADRAKHYEREQRRAQWLEYAENLAVAQEAWEANNALKAHAALAGSAEECRGLEYRLLHQRLHGRQVSLANPTAVHSVAWSPGGTAVVAGCKDGSIRVWDVSTRRIVKTLSGHTAEVTSLDFSRNAKRLFSASKDGTVKAWVDGECRRTITGHKGFHSVAASPDGSRILTSGEDGTAMVFNADTGELEVTIHCEQGQVNEATYLADGSRIATCGESGVIKVWDTQGKNLVTSRGPQRLGSLCLAAGPRGNRMACAGPAGEILIRACDSGDIQSRCFGHTAAVQRLRFSSDGRKIASASADGTRRIWEPTTGKLKAVLRGHTGVVHDVQFTRDSKWLASGGADGNLLLWELSNGQDFNIVRDSYTANHVAVSADGRRIASSSDDKTARVWRTQRHSSRTFFGHGTGVFCVDLTGDGQRAASGDGEGIVHVWDADSGKVSATLTGHSGIVWAVAFSPDRKFVASGGNDGSVRIHDADSGQERHALLGHRKTVTGLAFAPDGRLLASSSYDGTVRLWDSSDGRLMQKLTLGDQLGTGVAWSPDGEWVAASTGNPFELQQAGEVWVWEVASGREVLRLRGHTSGVSSIQFTPDGQRLLSGSWDKTIRVWETTFGLELLKLTGHSCPVVSMALNAGGSHLVCSEANTTTGAGRILIREAAAKY